MLHRAAAWAVTCGAVGAASEEVCCALLSLSLSLLAGAELRSTEAAAAGKGDEPCVQLLGGVHRDGGQQLGLLLFPKAPKLATSL